MSLLESFGQIALTFLGLIILAIPLYLTVGLLGGKRSLLNVVLVNLLTGFLFVAIHAQYPFWGLFIAFFLSLWLYREIFRLRWWKALIAYVLQFVLLFVFTIILAAIFAAIGLTGLAISAGILG
jgi:hypothetical protein